MATTLYYHTLERLHAAECTKQSCSSSETIREIGTVISDPNTSGLLPIIIQIYFSYIPCFIDLKSAEKHFPAFLAVSMEERRLLRCGYKYDKLCI